MLINRCPDLEELSVDGAFSPLPSINAAVSYACLGVSSRNTVALRLLLGHWPKLRKLSLGDVATEIPGFAPADPSSKRRFHAFVEAHDQLEELQLSGQVNLPPTSFSGMKRSALPHLERFGGQFLLLVLDYLPCRLTQILRICVSNFDTSVLPYSSCSAFYRAFSPSRGHNALHCICP
jgi:hypothetical protein